MVKMVKTNLVFSTITLITFLGLAKETITSSPDGQRFVLLPGSFYNITWRFDVTRNILVWAWSFTPRGSSSPQQLARFIDSGNTPQYLSRPFAFEVFKTGTLCLENVNESYNGEFTFTISTTPRTPPSKVNVYIAAKPNALINCSTPLVVSKGGSVSCVCRGEGGNPSANVTWYDKNNNIIGDVGVVNKTLVITNVTVNDGGSYRCKAQSYNDPRFRDEKSIEVTVKPTYPPQQTNITISPMSVKKGQNVTITCESDGYPEPTYTIYHNGAVISNKKTYIINSINFSNAGSYRCEATNKLGNDFSDVKNLTIIKDNVLCDDQKERIKQCKTEWYIILITLTSGIILGIFVSILFFLRYRQHWFNKKRQQFQSPPEVRKNPVDSTYQELDLLKMNKEDNYQSLRPKDETVDKTYQELDISKMNIEDSNYESLQKNNESEYVIADERRNYENSNLLF
ncbi:carcinoembryonic antigen-related cell adhesion molecule 6-like [Xenia sp. Carnegie-2017]|uniref:carcinoembryonic antigen-related cell adhesion molecule 6-like n=1 Tax=Xenia sp. Carnegie-2017 TaxID=2897299 RepID=UPI001F04AAC8|nr:carcinoembryonic antigen-related cell adhesion molecule 6-like [Xenia sp. Carnegie-2017]XP_046858264.1 carcinoembryonic antigen-related cell adhesion molecule 6-like [Xenia sp. Carnegie-2017]